MVDRIAAPKGTYDVLPADQPVRRWLIARAEDVFMRYGYRRIDTPVFETTGLFSRGVGESTDIVRKEMYTFTDLGGRSMTLRPEGTAPVARAYVEHGMYTLPQPVKLYYHSPMFRYENPQAGRYRQHYQLGVEAIGSNAPELDAEVIGVLATLFTEIGIRDTQLRLNSMAVRGADPRTRPACAPSSPSTQAGCAVSVRSAQRLILESLRLQSDSCRAIMASAPRLTDHLCGECATHHARVQECLSVQSIAYAADHTLVRGMDYYTRTTFEFTSSRLGAQAGVGGGGRYDDLIEAIGGRSVPGVGFGTGIERILLALGADDGALGRRRPVAYIVALADAARTAAFALAHELRTQGVEADLDYAGRSAKGQMTQADAPALSTLSSSGQTSWRTTC